LRNEFPELTLTLVATPEEALNKLTVGQVDAFVGNLASAIHLIQQRGLANIKVASATPRSVDISIGVRKDWPELATILNTGIQSPGGSGSRPKPSSSKSTRCRTP
jgi:ABC-type amino acid transport substrate-binding protein